jgi:hypothetical protein
MNVSRFRLQAATAALLALPLAPAAHAWPTVAVGGDVGTLGVGGHAVVEVQPWLNGRVSAHMFNYNTPVDVGGLDYDSKFQLVNFGTYADIYPLPGNGRLSLGMMYNGNKVNLHKTCVDGCEVDGMTVAGPDAQIDGALNFNKFAPYAGIGWGNEMSGSPFFILFDAGVMFQGTPQVDLNASGTANVAMNGVSIKGVNLQTDPMARSTLDYERSQISSDVGQYRYYPVMSLSMGWRF